MNNEGILFHCYWSTWNDFNYVRLSGKVFPGRALAELLTINSPLHSSGSCRLNEIMEEPPRKNCRSRARTNQTWKSCLMFNIQRRDSPVILQHYYELTCLKLSQQTDCLLLKSKKLFCKDPHLKVFCKRYISKHCRCLHVCTSHRYYFSFLTASQKKGHR